MSVYDYDLITIGGGSGGMAASRAAAALGAKVALIEADRMGGTCIIRGCVPKKIYMYASQFGDVPADAAAYGWSGGEARFDLASLLATKEGVVARIEHAYRGLLSEAGVRAIHARAELLDAHTVAAGGERLTAARILVATGSSPRHPPIPGIELALTSTGLLDLGRQPRRLLVLGGGYVGVEFAGIFNGFGSEVTLAYRDSLPLRGFDHDLRRRLAAAMQQRGIRLQAHFRAARIERGGDGFVCHGEGGERIEADCVLNAMGRAPNTAGLGLERAGVALRQGSGAVVVDAHSRSSVPGVFAVGDVTDRRNLTPVAIAEGRAFADTEFGGRPRTVDHHKVASAVFAQPPLAGIGLTEEQALEQGLDLRVYETDFKPLRNAVSGRDERSYMKLVVSAGDERVLGLHMLGADAPEIVQSLAVAVTMGATKADFDATMAVHPTAAEEFMLLKQARK